MKVDLKDKRIIGRKDTVDFPELNLKNIDIKIDTGAYTSAIHCRKIETKVVKGKLTLSFILLDPSHKQYEKKVFSTTNFKEKRIKNSFGNSEKRFIIKTNIKLFAKTYDINLSLSERGEMRFPVLIGRKFLIGKFVVDSSRFNLSHKTKVRKTTKKKQTK